MLAWLTVTLTEERRKSEVRWCWGAPFLPSSIVSAQPLHNPQLQVGAKFKVQLGGWYHRSSVNHLQWRVTSLNSYSVSVYHKTVSQCSYLQVTHDKCMATSPVSDNRLSLLWQYPSNIPQFYIAYQQLRGSHECNKLFQQFHIPRFLDVCSLVPDHEAIIAPIKNFS